MSSESVVVGAGAVVTAWRVGPTAWTVLTALAVCAEPLGGRLLARASVRSLAMDLGLNKDTVARALAPLRRDGLVVLDAAPFERGIYRVTVPPHVIRFSTDPGTDGARRRLPLAVAPGLQLTLPGAD